MSLFNKNKSEDTTYNEDDHVGHDHLPGEHPVGHDTSGPTTDEAMTRSKEELHVGTEEVETGIARLSKHVVTENVETTVPVSHEEVRLEREPITDANRGEALDGPAISEEEHEIVLHEERPVIAKETVPVERVRLDKETVTDYETVNEEVREERIDVDGGVNSGLGHDVDNRNNNDEGTGLLSHQEHDARILANRDNDGVDDGLRRNDSPVDNNYHTDNDHGNDGRTVPEGLTEHKEGEGAGQWLKNDWAQTKEDLSFGKKKH